MTANKSRKTNLMDLARSLGFTEVSPDDPIYHQGWIVQVQPINEQSVGRLKVPPLTVAKHDDPIYQRGLRISKPIAKPIQQDVKQDKKEEL